MSYNPSNGGIFSSIANLNSIPTEYDLVMQQQQQQDGYDELDMFMNTQLFDFDMGTVTENNSPTTGFGDNNTNPNDVISMMNMEQSIPQQQQIDYSLHPDFKLPFAAFPSTNNMSATQQPQQQLRPTPIPHHLQSHFPQIAPATTKPISAPATTTPTASTFSSPAPTSFKRPHGDISSPSVDELHDDDPSHAAAEEDKRRRNTAASARFRVKKKQREAALEKSAKEMSEKLRYLESRVGTLEMENKLLKELVTEKRGEEAVKGVEKLVSESAKL